MPYKMLGFASSLDLASNMPDVVEVVELQDGQKILHAVPDEKTKDFAGMVRSQMTNFSGFNYRTGQVVSRVRGDDFEKITKILPGAVPVSDYLKKKLRELIGQKLFGEDEEGLSFQEFRERFLAEAGHPLDIELFGFIGMKDFITFGVPDILELQLELSGAWKIVPLGSQEPQSPQDGEGELDSQLREELVKVLERNPYGLSVKKLLEYHRSQMDPANSDKLLEVALMSPDICFVDKFQSELTFLPGGFSHGKAKPNFPLHRLGDLKAEIRDLVRPLKQKVPLTGLQRALQGHNSLPNPADFNCETFLEVLLLMPDVVKVSRSQDGSFMIQPRRKGETGQEEEEEVTSLDIVQFPEDLLLNLRRVLVEFPGGVRGGEVAQHYRRITGQDLTCPGYTNTSNLLRDLSGRQGFYYDGKRFSSSCDVLTLPVLSLADLPTGWVEIIKEEASNSVLVVSQKVSVEIWNLESDMEEFYLTASTPRRLSLPPQDCVVGQIVAALYQDSAVYRARILQTVKERGGRVVVKVLYVDHGWTALLPQSALFRLDRGFSRVPQQVVALPLTEQDQAEGLCWLDNSREDARIVMADWEEDEEITVVEPVGKRGETEVSRTLVTQFILGLIINKARAQ